LLLLLLTVVAVADVSNEVPSSAGLVDPVRGMCEVWCAACGGYRGRLGTRPGILFEELFMRSLLA